MDCSAAHGARRSSTSFRSTTGAGLEVSSFIGFGTSQDLMAAGVGTPDCSVRNATQRCGERLCLAPQRERTLRAADLPVEHLTDLSSKCFRGEGFAQECDSR